MKEEIPTEAEKNLYRVVTKLPFSQLLKNKPPKGQTHAILDKDTGDILSFCSEDYHLRPNKILFSKFEKRLNQENLPFRKTIRIIDRTKFYVDYIILRRISSPYIKDLLPVLSIWNSYDGKVKTQIVFGYHKLLSGNRFCRPLDCLLQSSIKHNADDKTFFNQLIEEFITQSKLFLSKLSSDIEMYEKLYKKEESMSNFKKLLFKVPMLDKARTTAEAQLDREINKGLYFNENQEQVNYPGAPISYFTIYSAINYALYRNNDKELPEMKEKKDKILICNLVDKIKR